MTNPGVLILGTKGSFALSDLVFDARATPILRETMSATLAEMRKQKFVAVVVDYPHIEDDLLEFVLNVRDIDESMRVFVVTDDVEAAQEALPLSRGNLAFVTMPELVHKLTPARVPFEPDSRDNES